MTPAVAARLARLAIALDLRDGAMAPLLAAVGATAERGDILVGASAHERRVDVVLPFLPEAFAALGGAPARAPMPPTGLRASIDHTGALTAAVLAKAPENPRTAVDELAPPAARAAWFDYVDQFCAIAAGRPIAATRWLDGRVSLEILYPARAPASQPDIYILAAIDQLGAQLGVTLAQRTLWQKIHVAYGGADLRLTTSCTAAGAVSQILSLVYPEHVWEQAVHMAQGTALDPAQSAQIPRELGALAGALGSDRLDGVELYLGPREPMDVVVWAKLAPV